jgi:DNA-binding PucR family transcriptional regulator
LGEPDTLIGGVSSVRGEVAGYRVAYEEARRVVACIARFSRPGAPAVVAAPELGGGLVFLATADGELVTEFAETTLGWLVDDPSMGDLLTTLSAFFETAANIRRCAAGLGVHENTIRYRLGRIEELSGLAVAHDPDAQLQARLSLLVLILQGRVPSAALCVPAPTPLRPLEVVRAAAP